MKVSFVTFGCRLNRAEALELEARVAAAGHEVAQSPQGADLVVVRGCSVTAKAQRDCEREIARLRRSVPAARIVRMGCLPGATPIGELLASVGASESQRPPVPMSTSRAYIKIQDGCGGKCAFCIVPNFRGLPVSVPFGEVVRRAQEFIDAGYRELVVTGCNLALYRDGGRGLSDVLDALANVPSPERHRVRLGSVEPGLCGAELLDAMERNGNVCRYLHLSLQSASNAVLERMNRPYRIESVAEFVADARRRFGERLCLGADAIAGFPGESEEDFSATRTFLRERGFCIVHAFPYSERPGTAAAEMDGSIPIPVRKARAKILLEDAKERRRNFAGLFAGREVEVCVERGGDRGWTGEYLPVRLGVRHPRRSLVRTVFQA